MVLCQNRFYEKQNSEIGTMIAVADAHVARLARLTFTAAAQLFSMFILRVGRPVHRAHRAATAAGRRRLQDGRGHGRNGIGHHRNEKENDTEVISAGTPS